MNIDISENYLNLQGWMMTKLNLSGNELLAFGLIYGFTQDGQSFYYGSINYLSTWLNTSRPTVIKALKGLVKKNYLIKEEVYKDKVKYCYYKANIGVVKKLNRGSKENLPDGSKESLPNNLPSKPKGESKPPTPQKEKPINQLSKEEKEAIEYDRKLKAEQQQANKIKELNNEAPPDWKPEHAKDKYADQQDPNPRDLSYYDFAKEYAPAKHEQLIMRYSKRIKDSDTFIRKFNNKCIKKDVEFNTKKILAELEDYALNWLSFAKKFDNNNQQTPKQL